MIWLQALARLIAVTTPDRSHDQQQDPQQCLEWLQSCLGTSADQAICAAGGLLNVLVKVCYAEALRSGTLVLVCQGIVVFLTTTLHSSLYARSQHVQSNLLLVAQFHSLQSAGASAEGS